MRMNYIIISYNYVFSIFCHDFITTNLGNYRTDMTIASTALNQSKLLNYFQLIIIYALFKFWLAGSFMSLKNIRVTMSCNSATTIYR